MVILYGTKNFKRQKGLSRNYMHCDHCGKDAKWQFVHLWTWFTLFYIPLFPVWRKQMLICPFCNWGIKIDGKNRETILPEIELDGKKGMPPQVGTAQPQQINTAPQYASVPQQQYANASQQQTQYTNAPQQQHTNATQQWQNHEVQYQQVNAPQYANATQQQYRNTAQQPYPHASRQPADTRPCCSYCGKPLKEHARFCQYCGQAVPQENTASRQSPSAGNQHAEPPQGGQAEFMKSAQRMKICPSCHLLFPADKVKCGICGSMLEEKK